MSKSKKDHEKEAVEAAEKAAKEYADEQRKSAEDARGEVDTAETEEEYYERRAAATQSGIFGDLATDTDAGGVAVPVGSNEDAGVSVAQADASGETSKTSDQGKNAQSEGEARRQQVTATDPAVKAANEKEEPKEAPTVAPKDDKPKPGRAKS